MAETIYINLGLPFLQTYSETIDTEHSPLSLKYNIQNTFPHKQEPFSQISQFFNFILKNYIYIAGHHIRVFNFPHKKTLFPPAKQPLKQVFLLFN